MDTNSSEKKVEIPKTQVTLELNRVLEQGNTITIPIEMDINRKKVLIKVVTEIESVGKTHIRLRMKEAYL